MVFDTILILSCVYFHIKKKIKFYIENFSNFFKIIDIKKYISTKFQNTNTNYFKNNNFNEFINENKNFWSKQQVNIKSDDAILMESFVNHPAYALSNCVLAIYLKKIYGKKITGIIKKSNLHGRKIFESFLIDNIILIEETNLIQRIISSFICLKILKKNREIKSFLKIKYKNTDVGLSAYDSFIRYTGISHLDKLNHELFFFLTEAVAVCDQFEKIIKKNNFKISVQAETSFLPLNCLFQLSLFNKINIFSRLGVDDLAVRIYKDFKERYLYRDIISNKFFNYILIREKNNIISKYERIQQKKIRSGSFGIDLKVISKKKKKPIVNRNKLNKIFNWKNKKIGVIFLHHLIDRNFHNGPRKFFTDNYSWGKYILNQLKYLKNYNWIIKHHPTEQYYKSKVNLNKEIEFLTKNYSNIKLFPQNISQISLLNIADLCITSHGSATLEYIANGTPSLFVENSYYSHMRFAKKFRCTKKQLEKLKITKNLRFPTLNDIQEAKAFIYTKSEYLKSKSSLIPKHDISRNLDEDKFWKSSIKLVKNFNYDKDELMQMLKIQIDQNLRHTINNNKIKIENILKND